MGLALVTELASDESNARLCFPDFHSRSQTHAGGHASISRAPKQLSGFLNTQSFQFPYLHKEQKAQIILQTGCS